MDKVNNFRFRPCGWEKKEVWKKCKAVEDFRADYQQILEISRQVETQLRLTDTPELRA